MYTLTRLVCDGVPKEGAIGEVFAHLADSLDRLIARTIELKKAGVPVDLALYGPLLGRATLEVAFTSILGRFDPLRLLAIRKSQLSSSYDVRERNAMAFNWSSDVRGEEKPKSWEQKPAVRDVQRALLCKHFNDLFWEEAFMALVDKIPDHRGAVWMDSLKRIFSNGFASSLRPEADRLYAELSKAIHHEFIIPAVAQYDTSTISDLLSRSWELVANLAITTHFSPVAHPINTEIAIGLYEQAQQECEQ